MHEELIDANEAARITGLQPPTIRKLAYQGRIPAYRVLGALRFRRADVSALVVERPPRGGRGRVRGHSD
jgi:excisionase family DNA binding protein